MIYAALNGLENKLDLPEAANINLYKADAETLAGFKKLPESLSDACKEAAASEFIKEHVPAAILEIYCNK